MGGVVSASPQFVKWYYTFLISVFCLELRRQGRQERRAGVRGREGEGRRERERERETQDGFWVG